MSGDRNSIIVLSDQGLAFGNTPQDGERHTRPQAIRRAIAMMRAGLHEGKTVQIVDLGDGRVYNVNQQGVNAYVVTADVSNTCR